jgi:hypothetical protein
MMGDVSSNSVSYSVTCSLMTRAGIFPSGPGEDIKHVATLAAYCEKLLLINNIVATSQDFIIQ